MVLSSAESKVTKSAPFRVYKLTKAGHTRYLNIGAVLPENWVAVKMTVSWLDDDCAVLKLERIK